MKIRIFFDTPYRELFRVIGCYVCSLFKKMSLLSLLFLSVSFSSAAETEPGMGFVLLSFDIDEAGKPINIRVIDSEPKLIFDKSAMSALSKWKYKPKVVDGVAVIQKNLKVQLDFELDEGRK